jgi:hypothetical protein
MRNNLGEKFSQRHGYRGPEREIKVREEAPKALRIAISAYCSERRNVPYGNAADRL